MPTGVHMKLAKYRKLVSRRSHKMWRQPGFRRRQRHAVEQAWKNIRALRVPATSTELPAPPITREERFLTELDDYQRRLSLQHEMIQKGLDAVATVRLIITSFNGGPLSTKES